LTWRSNITRRTLEKIANAYSMKMILIKHETLLFGKEFTSERVAAAYIA